MSQGAAGTPPADWRAALRAAVAAGRVADVLQAAEALIVTATDPAVVVEAVTARADALAQVGLAADAFSLLQNTRGQERAAGRAGQAGQLSMAESALRMASGDAQAAMSALIEAANDFGDARPGREPDPRSAAAGRGLFDDLAAGPGARAPRRLPRRRA